MMTTRPIHGPGASVQQGAASGAIDVPLLDDRNVRRVLPVDIIAERRKLEAIKCRRSFAYFVQRAWANLEPGKRIKWNWHLTELCIDLQIMVAELLKAQRDPRYRMKAHNYLANIPPRMGKSMIFSVFLPAWIWIDNPHVTIRCVSGNPRVAQRDSRKSRQLIGDPWYQNTFKPQWQIRSDVDAVGLFENTKGGSRRSHGWTATIIGEGSDIIIVDDPNDAKKSRSETERSSVNATWTDAIENRVNDELAHLRIAIMQRLHEEDWTGYVLARETWIHRIITMEYETTNSCKCKFCKGQISDIRDYKDPRTEDGELLHPARGYTPDWVIKTKIKLGSYGYAGQHQQRPAPADGGMFKFKDWRFWKPDGVAPELIAPRPEKCYTGYARALPALTSFSQIIISVDAAFKDADTSDRVAMFVIGVHGADRYVLDRRCDRMSFTATLRALEQLSADWPRAMMKLVEDKANGTAVIDFLKSKIPGLIAVNPEGGKESRAAILSPSVEAGNWYLPDGASWLEDFTGEFATFPLGANDDQVDALSQAAVRLQGSQHLARAMAAYGSKN